MCYPFLKYTGYSITLRKATVCVWAGLRGAVGLALSMFLLFDGQVSDRSFRLLAFFFMGMIAAITILVQGTTTGLLLQVCIPSRLEVAVCSSNCIITITFAQRGGRGPCAKPVVSEYNCSGTLQIHSLFVHLALMQLEAGCSAFPALPTVRDYFTGQLSIVHELTQVH